LEFVSYAAWSWLRDECRWPGRSPSIAAVHPGPCFQTLNANLELLSIGLQRIRGCRNPATPRRGRPPRAASYGTFPRPKGLSRPRDYISRTDESTVTPLSSLCH